MGWLLDNLGLVIACAAVGAALGVLALDRLGRPPRQ